ncbi:hypothetical protein HDK77DRAFT_202355 [Phyllosticta capitalensis]
MSPSTMPYLPNSIHDNMKADPSWTSTMAMPNSFDPYPMPFPSSSASFSAMPEQSLHTSNMMDFSLPEDLSAYASVLETYTDYIRPKLPAGGPLTINTHGLSALPNTGLPLRPHSSPCVLSPSKPDGSTFDTWPSHYVSSMNQNNNLYPLGNHNSMAFSQPASTSTRTKTSSPPRVLAPVPIRPYPSPSNLAKRGTTSRSNSRGKGTPKLNKTKKIGSGIGSVKRPTVKRVGSFGLGHYTQPKTEDALAKENMAKFLLEVKVVKDVSWKDVRQAFLAKRDEDCTVEQLQMRFTRFCRDTGLWTEEDNDSLKQGKYDMTKFAIIKQRMHETQILSKLGNPYARIPQAPPVPLRRTPSAEDMDCMEWLEQSD